MPPLQGLIVIFNLFYKQVSVPTGLKMEHLLYLFYTGVRRLTEKGYIFLYLASTLGKGSIRRLEEICRCFQLFSPVRAAMFIEMCFPNSSAL